VFTKARHGSYPEPDEFNPHLLNIDISSGSFHSGFPNKILYAFLMSPICATCSPRRMFRTTVCDV